MIFYLKIQVTIPEMLSYLKVTSLSQGWYPISQFCHGLSDGIFYQTDVTISKKVFNLKACHYLRNSILSQSHVTVSEMVSYLSHDTVSEMVCYLKVMSLSQRWYPISVMSLSQKWWNSLQSCHYLRDSILSQKQVTILEMESYLKVKSLSQR